LFAKQKHVICTVSVVLVVYCRLVVHIETQSDTRAQKWLAIAYSSLAHYRIGCAWPTLRGANPFTTLLTFCMLGHVGVYTLPTHFFNAQKQYW